jgi:hypothetical protein
MENEDEIDIFEGLFAEGKLHGKGKQFFQRNGELIIKEGIFIQGVL